MKGTKLMISVIRQRGGSVQGVLITKMIRRGRGPDVAERKRKGNYQGYERKHPFLGEDLAGRQSNDELRQ